MRTVSAILLCVGVAHAGDPIAEHDKAHGRPELARIGTVGDRPPLASTLVVHIHADGAILIDGKETTLKGLGTALARLRQRHEQPSVLLRADARLPWKTMLVVLAICVEQKIHRVFHAVLPESGDEERAFLWPLPQQGKVVDVFPHDVSLWYHSYEGQPLPTFEHLHWAMREAKPRWVRFYAGLVVPLGLAIRSADALCRAGVGKVTIDLKVPEDSSRASDLRPLVKKLARRKPRAGDTEGVGKEIGLEQLCLIVYQPDGKSRELGKEKVEPLPAVERRRGAPAGFAFPMELQEVSPLSEIPYDEAMPWQEAGGPADDEELPPQDPDGAPGGDPGGG